MIRRPLLDRFFDKVVFIPEHACWEWDGAGRNGYGRIQRGAKGSRLEMAHRVSWELHHGPIPEGLFVCHRCDNRSCVNPDHLFLGSGADNMADCKAKDRHSAGERHGRAKITEDQVLEILDLLLDGLPQRKIAKMYGISQRQVLSIKQGEAWGWVGK